MPQLRHKKQNPRRAAGAGEFDFGDSEVTLDMQGARNGRFRAAQQAERFKAGTVTLRAKSCNQLALIYDYSALGLGSGNRKLRLISSLETAGFNYRDLDARMANRD